MYALLYLATLSVFITCNLLFICHSQLVADPYRASLGLSCTAPALGFPLDLSPLHTGPGPVFPSVPHPPEPHTHLLSDHNSHRHHTSCSSLQPPEGPTALLAFCFCFNFFGNDNLMEGMRMCSAAPQAQVLQLVVWIAVEGEIEC
jgi:hypothetical protein